MDQRDVNTLVLAVVLVLLAPPMLFSALQWGRLLRDAARERRHARRWRALGEEQARAGLCEPEGWQSRLAQWHALERLHEAPPDA